MDVRNCPGHYGRTYRICVARIRCAIIVIDHTGHTTVITRGRSCYCYRCLTYARIGCLVLVTCTGDCRVLIIGNRNGHKLYIRVARPIGDSIGDRRYPDIKSMCAYLTRSTTRRSSCHYPAKRAT